MAVLLHLLLFQMHFWTCPPAGPLEPTRMVLVQTPPPPPVLTRGVNLHWSYGSITIIMSSIWFNLISRCITVNWWCKSSIFSFTSHVYNFFNKCKQSDTWTEPLILSAQGKHAFWMYQTKLSLDTEDNRTGIKDCWFTHSMSSPGRA